MSLYNYLQPRSWMHAGQSQRVLIGRMPIANESSTRQQPPGVNSDLTVGSYGVMDALLIGWLAGAGTLAGLTILRALRVRRVVRHSITVSDPIVLDALRAANQLALCRRNVGVCTSPEVSSPVLTGILRPTILLHPVLIQNPCARSLQFIFLHELVHLRRADLLVSWIAAVLQILHWFNPVIWYAFRKMRGDCEVACDAAVVRRAGQANAADYGRVLLRIAEQAQQRWSGAGVLAVVGAKSQITRRIECIVACNYPGRSSWILALTISCVLIGLNFTAAQPQASSTMAMTSDPAAIPSTRLPANATSTTSESLSLGSIENKPFRLAVADKGGELNYKFGPNHELESIEAHKDVVFSTDATTITCADLSYDPKKQLLVASGPSMEVRRGELTLTGDTYRLDVRDGKGELKGNARVVTKDASGRTKTTSGETIIIYDGKSGSQTMMVKGSTATRASVKSSSP
jgi:beta-lactamase regulating signal transducer with metallopeptidase domain